MLFTDFNDIQILLEYTDSESIMINCAESL